MARRDYLIFIHGVNVRERRESPTYADALFELIEKEVSAGPIQTTLVKLSLYWGDVGEADEDSMMEEVKQSQVYSNFHLKNVREKQIQQFVGDAALYISRACGAKVVDRINDQVRDGFENLDSADDNRVHLIAHSWGTVIFFDILFASRWDSPRSPAYAAVQYLRDIWCGIEPNRDRGLCIRSIHTMGSPLAMFSLIERTSVPQVPSRPLISMEKLNALAGVAGPIDVAPPPEAAALSSESIERTHTITRRLQELVESLYGKLSKPLVWRNFCHPGDLVAYPLSVLMPTVLAGTEGKIIVQDHLVADAGPQRFEWCDLAALIRSPQAHGSYWQSKVVAKAIAEAISST